MPVVSTILGPGTLTLGEAPKDVSSQVRGCMISPSKSQEDSIPVLSGEEVAGAVTYQYALSGTLLQDLGQADGVVEFTWANAGKPVPFAFTPNSDAGASFTGIVVVDPVAVGGEEATGVLESEFEFACVGPPTPSWATAAP